jgi:hypothetical protein
MPTGGLVINAGPTSSDLTLIKSAGNTTINTLLEIPKSSLMDPARVIAQAFEVRNVTAELFKQGDVIVFEQPLNSRDYPVTLTQVDADPPTVAGSSYSAKARTMPPRSQQEATILPSSRRFEARDGCYVVGALETLSNPPAIGAPTVSLLYDHADSADTPWPDTGSTVYITGNTPSIFRNFTPSLVTPFGRRGAYFSGLSPETTLKINYKVTVERFPSSTSPVVNFARPTPTRDEAALEVYTEILNRMPVGVPVSENGLGDWFTGAVAEIIDSVTGTTFATKADKWQKEWSKPKQEKVDTREMDEINRKLKMIEEWEKANRANHTEHLKRVKASLQPTNPPKRNSPTTVTIPPKAMCTPLKAEPPKKAPVSTAPRSNRNPRK